MTPIRIDRSKSLLLKRNKSGLSWNMENFILQDVAWPKVRGQASRKQFWFQQDWATVHSTTQVRDWLKEKLVNRVISRFIDHPWLSRRPDLSPLDCWF